MDNPLTTEDVAKEIEAMVHEMDNGEDVARIYNEIVKCCGGITPAIKYETGDMFVRV